MKQFAAKALAKGAITLRQPEFLRDRVAEETVPQRHFFLFDSLVARYSGD
jgi:hypothetical protein